MVNTLEEGSQVDTLKDWVVQEIENIAAFGKKGRGITRLAYTPQDTQAREYVISVMKQLGLVVRVDEVGNIIGRLEGLDSHAPIVATGSHLDTVPDGGKYDGVVGVIGGLAAIQQLKKAGPLTHSVEVIVFAGEESSRFGVATIGSKVMAGLTNTTAWKRAKDLQGVSLAETLREEGFFLEQFSLASRKEDELKAFIELHIEQGVILDKATVDIGIVEKIAAPTRFKITVEGVAAHSGTTPMENRQDALICASKVILAIREIAMEQADKGTVVTVGAMNVYPGAMNVIPGRVDMWVDVRGLEHESVIECLQEIKDEVSTIADEDETAISIEMIVSEKPVNLDQGILRLIENCCIKTDKSFLQMNSNAGHDAMNMAKIAPTGMIFIPSKGGISHHPDEYSSIEDIMKGIEVLTVALLELAK